MPPSATSYGSGRVLSSSKAMNSTNSLHSNYQSQTAMKEKLSKKIIQNKREYKILFPTMRGDDLSSTHSPSKADE